MKIYIDQSSKIEYTNQNTVVAFSNHHHKSVLLKSKDKKQLEKFFRVASKPKLFIYKTFAVLICLLIESEIKTVSQIIIDTEYTGQNNLIKNLIYQTLKNHGHKINRKLISFAQVGKKAKCHQIAIDTLNHKIKPTEVISLKKVLRYLL